MTAIRDFCFVIACGSILFLLGRFTAPEKQNDIDINSLVNPRDYQMELHNDTTWLYDGDRLVGITIDSAYSGKGLYDLIMTDNE